MRSSYCVAELQGLRNVILTPHIGGSTEEAQAAIGSEVSAALTKYVNRGATSSAVNFPQVPHTSSLKRSPVAIGWDASCEGIVLKTKRCGRYPHRRLVG